MNVRYMNKGEHGVFAKLLWEASVRKLCSHTDEMFLQEVKQGEVPPSVAPARKESSISIKLSQMVEERWASMSSQAIISAKGGMRG